jgi:hypothetical protein
MIYGLSTMVNFTPATISQRHYQAFLAFWQNKSVIYDDLYPLYKTQKQV